MIAAAGALNVDPYARMLGIALPIRAELLQALLTDVAPPVFPHVVTHACGNLTLKQQRGSGNILIGGAWPGDGDPRSRQKRVRPESLRGNVEWAGETIPAIAHTRLLRSWVGFEGRTPDRRLLCGPLGPRGASACLGCAAGGFTLAPIAGQIAAEFVVFGKPRISCDELNVQRFLQDEVVSEGGS